MDHHNSTDDSRKAIIANEFAWHEHEAHRRIPLDTFLYAPPAFDLIVRSGFEFLQMNSGETVLEVGCGEGKETLRLTQLGLCVISTDLSRQQLCRAREQLQELAPGARGYFLQANAEELPFASDSFRTIYGKAILHHLDIDLSAGEIRRLLGRNGRATLAEPMAHHPLFWLARQLTPRLRTKDEHPLTFWELRHFCTYFGRSSVEEHFLLAPVAYAVRALPGGEPAFQRLQTFLQRIDRWLFHTFPFLRELAWYGLVKVSKCE